MRTFLRRVFAFLLFLFALALVGSACTITIGPYDDTGGTAPPKTSVPPDPQGGPADEPPLDEAQQARLEETEGYTRTVIYKGGEILHSIQLPSGDVVDFLNRDTLPGLPYEPPKLELPQGVGFGLTELEQLPELAELLANAVPYLRPTFWPYILGEAPDATSIEDYLARYQVGGHGDGAEGGQVSGIKRLYAGLESPVPNRGVFGYMNQFRPKVDKNGFSLLELAVFCPVEDPVEMIGIVISVDKRNKFGTDRQKLQDEDPRLHIEYARPPNGQFPYVWDGMDGTFVANPFRVHHPGEKVPVSEVGGAQEEHLMAIVQSASDDWWIIYKGDVLGYYPASLFTMLNGGACGAAWYGEIFNYTPGSSPETEMGSGQFPEAGMPNIAYVRYPMYYDLSWVPVEPLDDYHSQPFEPLCYGRAPLADGILGLGGPGGFNLSCKWP
jgi:hypothetical protein